MRKIMAVVLMIMSILAAPALAESTYTSIDRPFVNAGDHSWVTFYFGHLPNGEPGTAALIVQCAFHRAELIINFDVYGMQMTSRFFAVTCSQSGPIFVGGKPTTTYTLNATPLNDSLVMYGVNASGNLVTENLNLTTISATWTVSGYAGNGATPTVTGGAEIAY